MFHLEGHSAADESAIPSFSPPWAITFSSGNSMVLTVQKYEVLWLRHDPISSYELSRAATTINIESKNIIDPWPRRPSRKSKVIPKHYAKEPLRPFAGTLLIAHWPTDRDLVQIDGSESFAVSQKTRVSRAHICGLRRTILAKGTRTEQLVTFAESLASYCGGIK